MSKTVLGLLFVTMTITGTVGLAPGVPVQDTQPASRPSTDYLQSAQRVWKLSLAEGQGHGSATPIARVRGFVVFLTCSHVTEAGVPDTLTLGNRTLRVSAHFSHIYMDAALVWAQTDEHVDLVPLAAEMPAFGTQLWAVGYPLGHRLLTHGYMGEGGVTSVPLAPGNSGGAILNAKGGLVGMAQQIGRMASGPVFHVSRFVPISDLRQWILDSILE